MNAERRFRRTVLFTALAGHMAYAIAAEKPGLALVGLLATILSAWLVRQTLAGTPRPLPRALLNGLVIAAILHLILQLLARSQEVITSLTDFLAYVMLVKSLDRTRMRDEAQLLGLSLFVVIGALLTGQSLAMGMALVAYTPLAITATVSLQLFAAVERQHDLLKSVGLADQSAALDTQLERQRAPRATAFVAAACVIASMTAGVVAFVITPRSLAQQLGMTASPFLKSHATDFSDSISLGNKGNISEDNTPVIDVKPIGAPGTVTAVGPIYLRGAVLTDYNKGVWTGDPIDGSRTKPPTIESAPKPVTRPEISGLDAGDTRNRTTYEIIQRNTKATEPVPLFVPLQPISISTENPGALYYRDSDSLLWINRGGGRLIYTVTSATDYRNTSAGTERPPASGSPEIKALAQRLLSERSVPAEPFTAGPLEVRRAAQAIEAYLATFEYTLEMTAPKAGQDAIEMFLFDTKRGHCEYFAAGMVSLLRSVGIPSRIATGYVAAEFNSVSGYFTVRKSDAHAWVEVQMEPGRWETFDPTPVGELQSTRRASGGPLGWIKHVWDAIEFSWLDNVVAYDKGIKLDVIGLSGRSDPGAAAVKWQERLRKWQMAISRYLPKGVLTRSLVVGVLTFGLVMGIYWLIRLGGKGFKPLRALIARLIPGRRRPAAEGIPIPADAAFYKEALAVLAAAGSAKPSPAPPLSFADTLSTPAATPLRTIASLYYQSRFGGTPLTAQQQATGNASLADLKAALGPQARPRT